MSIVVQMINMGHGEAILLGFENACNDKSESENESGMAQTMKNTFCILIDAGSEKSSCYKDAEGKVQRVSFNELKKKLEELKWHINGIIITHIDDDHIGGFIKLFGKMYDEIKNYMNLVFVLFNDFDQHKIGFRQANSVSQLLRKRLKETNTTILKSYQENYIIKNAKISQFIELDGELLSIKFYDIQSRKALKKIEKYIIHITLLYPTGADITVNNLMMKWKKYNEDPKRNNENSEQLKNENSIAVLIEYEQCKMIFGGDGYLKNIILPLEELKRSPEKVLKLNVMKLFHHGAKENNKEILNFITSYQCEKLLYCTNSVSYNDHPNIEMLCDILRECPDIEIYATNIIPEEVWNKQGKDLQGAKAREILKNILGMKGTEWVTEQYKISKEDVEKQEVNLEDQQIKKIILEFLNKRIKKIGDLKNGIIVK